MLTADNVRPQTKPAILVAEDNYLTGIAVSDIVRDAGFDVAGPVARLESGLDLIEQQPIGGAIVDINLRGTQSYPLCRALTRSNVPFAFLTGSPPSSIAPAFRSAPYLAKPVDARQLRAVLTSFGAARAQTPPSPAEDRCSGNLLLQALVEEDRRLLEPRLERVALQPGEILETAGRPPSHVYFPSSGIVSLAARAGDHQLEAALIGREGLVGIAAVMAAAKSSHQATVRYSGGEAWRLPARELLAVFAESPRLHAHLLGYAHALLQQVSSNLVCASRGTIEERVAQWLLATSERQVSRDVQVTHEEIAQALGVRRAGVTVCLHILEGKQALRNERRRIRILDRSELLSIAGSFQED